MDITPLIASDQQIVQGYSAGRFRITGQVYETPVIVTPQATAPWAVIGPASLLTVDDFAPVAARISEIDVVLFGSGAKSERLDPALVRALKSRGISVDMMDTGAACRTYNVLMMEGRRVLAALLPL